jgi:hypothetical protein
MDAEPRQGIGDRDTGLIGGHTSVCRAGCPVTARMRYL